MGLVDDLWAQLSKLDEEGINLTAARNLEGLADLTKRRDEVVQALKGTPNDVIWNLVAQIGSELGKLATATRNREEIVQLSGNLAEIAELVRRGLNTTPVAPASERSGTSLTGSASGPTPPPNGAAGSASSRAPAADRKVTGWVSRDHLDVARAAFTVEPFSLDLVELEMRTKKTLGDLRPIVEGIKKKMLGFDAELADGYEFNPETATIIRKIKQRWPARTITEILGIIDLLPAPIHR